jgi:hypothetical protein
MVFIPNHTNRFLTPPLSKETEIRQDKKMDLLSSIFKAYIPHPAAIHMK